MTAVMFTTSPGEYRTVVRFRYDPAVVATIKQTVPGHSRSWDAQRRVWYIDADWVSILAAELRRHGHVVTGVDQPPPRHDASRRGDGDWARQLFRRVGHRRADQVYRALSRCFHPDLPTGDATLQRELTDARNELTEGAQ